MLGSGWRHPSSAKRGKCKRSPRRCGCHFLSMVAELPSGKLGPRGRGIPSSIVVPLQETGLPGWLGETKRRDDRTSLRWAVSEEVSARWCPIGGREESDHHHLPAVANRAFPEGLAAQFFV